MGISMETLLKRIELRHLRLVKTIAAEGGLSAAARYLHLTQSALSHQLKVLEDALGEILFHRIGKKLVITESGRRVLKTAEQVLGELSLMSNDLTKIRQGQKVNLRLATECYTSFHWLPKVIPEFKRQYPEVEIALRPQATNELLSLLEAGDLDIAIRMAPVKDRYQNHILFSDELVVVMAPDHALAGSEVILPEQLAQQSLLLCPNAKEKLLKGLSYYVNINDIRTTELPLTEAIVEWCGAGLGVAVMASWAAQPWLDKNEVLVRPLDVSWAKRSWSAVTLPHELPIYMKDFISLLQANPPL